MIAPGALFYCPRQHLRGGQARRRGLFMGLIMFMAAVCHWVCVLNVQKNNAHDYLSAIVKLGTVDIWSVLFVAPISSLFSHFDKRFLDKCLIFARSSRRSRMTLFLVEDWEFVYLCKLVSLEKIWIPGLLFRSMPKCH
jgi:hypothetical protein